MWDYKVYSVEHRNELDKLYELLGNKRSDGSRVAPVGQAVAIRDVDIVKRVFPELIESMDDGLIDLRLLEPIYKKGENDDGDGILIPGVYKREGFLIFAHHFFRRSLSLANATNDEFFYVFEHLRENENLKLKIALDFDMIGLAGTENLEAEYQYWWGPKFNDKLSDIPEDVTIHKNEHYDNVFSNITETQFYWHTQDGYSTFECEEICDRENIMNDIGEPTNFGCRYVHSMINREINQPFHLDGAIRIYSDEEFVNRIDESTDIRKFGKGSKYKKLWRIDNDIPVAVWKEVITHFFRDNQLIGEYFGGVDEKYKMIKEDDRSRNREVKKVNAFIPVDLNKGDGIRAYCKYIENVKIPDEREAKVISRDMFVFRDGAKEKILEADTITFLKLLKAKGVAIRIPYTTEIEFGDTVFNYPIIACKNVNVAERVLDAIFELCEAWNRVQDNRLLSFALSVNINDQEAMQISFAGHIADFVKVHVKIPQISTMEVEDWIDAFYEVNNSFDVANDEPDKFLLIHGDVVCFDRNIVDPGQVERQWMERKNGMVRLKLSEEEAKYAQKHRIICAPFYKINTSICSRCGKDYRTCECIKFIDPEVRENIESAELWGMTWTNRSAYFPNGQLEFTI